MFILKKHRVVSLALVMLMVFSCISSFLINVSAEDFKQNNLNNYHKNIYAADNFTGLDEFEPVSKVVTILPGQNNPIDFDILYVLDDVTLDSVIHQKDKDATIHQKDLDSTIHQKDLETTIHQKDKDATIHQKDLEAIDIYSDEVKEPIYNEEYLFRDDIKLGNSFDPFGEYAVRIN